MENPDAFENELERKVGGRELNDVERAALLSDILGVRGVPVHRVRKWIELLGIPVNPVTVSRFLRLHRSRSFMKKAVAEGRLSLPVFALLSRMDEADQRAILRVFSTLRLGVNYQRELVRLCGEVSARERISAAEILAKTRLEVILRSERSSGPDRKKLFFRALRGMSRGKG